MVSTIQEVNFPKAVAKIRQANLGILPDDWRVTYTTADQIGLTLSDMNWQVVGLAKPTEQEMIDAYNLWLAEEDAEELAIEQDKQTIVDETELYTLVRADYVLAYQLLNQLNRVFTDGNIGSPTQDALYSGFVSAINGTNLEQPIRDKVLASTTLTDFVTPTALEKERIMVSSENFLQTLVIVGIVKQFI